MKEDGRPFDVIDENPPGKVYRIEPFLRDQRYPNTWSYRLQGATDVFASAVPGSPRGKRPERFNLNFSNQTPAVILTVRALEP